MLAACARPGAHHEESYVFGTRVEITTWGVEEAKATKAVGAVLREFDRLHRAIHAWEPSELTAVNSAIAQGRTATVSPELAGMLVEAKEMAARGDYLFDPAIGGLIGLWGFQNDHFEARLPAPEAVEKLLLAHPSMADVQIVGHQVSSRNPAVRIDLGGFAKGWALDRAVTILRANGVENALVNIGGNLIALGSKDGTPWRVGIQHPRRGGALATLNLKDGEAIGTSGDYQRFFDLGGERYCHLLDPRSGRPAQGTESLSILITAQKRAGTLSDASSKPAFIDAAHWRQRLKAYGIANALRVDARGNIEVTAAMARRVEFGPDLPKPRILD
jgi:thiamine biosynthesis lipoprotein